MLKKINRIGLDKDFDRAFKLGQSFYGQSLGLKAVNNIRSLNRLGILISTKVSKKAVVRNRLKRQIRAIMRMEWLKLANGKDLVVIVFPQILNKNFQEITELVKAGLRKLKLYKK